jgi:hypothetical protein
VAKVPNPSNHGCFPKAAFVLDLDAGRATCPGGRTTRDFRPAAAGGGQFRFAAAACAACPLRARCVRGVGGRTVAVHPQERLLRAARAFQASPAFAEYRRRRQVVEQRIARLVQLGIRQARDVGIPKVRFQLLIAAAVANLTDLAATTSQPTDAIAGACHLVGTLSVLLVLLVSRTLDPARPLGAPHDLSLIRITSPGRQLPSTPTRFTLPGCRPGF